MTVRWCREGMKKGGVRLLEPVMKVEVSTPEEHMGDVIGDLNSRRGIVGEFVDRPGNVRLIKSFVPLSEMCARSSSSCLRGRVFTIKAAAPRKWQSESCGAAAGVSSVLTLVQ